MLLTTATEGVNWAMEPSLSSTSATKRGPWPTRALAKGASGVMKLFISAPLTMVGSRPAFSNIQPIMAVVVDLPLVPATPTRAGAALNKWASRAARVTIGAPARRAA